MMLLRDTLFAAELSLGFFDAFEKVSEFALGYPVKRMELVEGRLVLNAGYRKAFCFYHNIRIQVAIVDNFVSRLRVTATLAVNPFHLLKRSDTSPNCFDRTQLRRELALFLEPHILPRTRHGAVPGGSTAAQIH